MTPLSVARSAQGGVSVGVGGVLFAAYHLHVPWLIPANFPDTLAISYPTKRYQSAWIGIAVHSAQSLFFTLLVLTFVLK